MNKKEILEIRKQVTKEHSGLTRICGCYVDGEKNKILEIKEAFLSLPEEDAFKYFTLFKQTLSGTLGKNLLNLEFPLDAEKTGGGQEFLLQLRNSRLEDEMLLEEFYNKVIESYQYGENYYIILVHGTYDIPGKSSDGLEMFDASEDVYDYMLCSICPVKLSKPGLCYNTDKNNIENRIRDWVVEAPVKGFLFPAFTDRNTDIHSALYYSKDADELQADFIQAMLGCGMPMTAKDQKESFQTVLTDALGDECDYTVMKNIHENLSEMLEETKDNPDPLVLTQTDIKKVLEQSGVSDERIQEFDQQFETVVGERETLLASNLINTRKVDIATPDISIKVNPERMDLIETRVVDGKKCLVITVDDSIEINGIPVRTIRREDGIEE